MIWFWIIILASLAWIIYDICEWGFSFCHPLIMFTMTLVAFLVLLLTSAASSEIAETVPVESTTQTLVAMQDNRDIEGHGSFISRSVETNSYYYYLTETEKGIKLNKQSTNSSYIKYLEEGETPYVEILTFDYKNKKLNEIFWGPCVKNDEYVFHIPKDSIISEYKIDLQ